MHLISLTKYRLTYLIIFKLSHHANNFLSQNFQKSTALVYSKLQYFLLTSDEFIQPYIFPHMLQKRNYNKSTTRQLHQTPVANSDPVPAKHHQISWEITDDDGEKLCNCFERSHGFTTTTASNTFGSSLFFETTSIFK